MHYILTVASLGVRAFTFCKTHLENIKIRRYGPGISLPVQNRTLLSIVISILLLCFTIRH